MRKARKGGISVEHCLSPCAIQRLSQLLLGGRLTFRTVFTFLAIFRDQVRQTVGTNHKVSQACSDLHLVACAPLGHLGCGAKLASATFLLMAFCKRQGGVLAFDTTERCARDGLRNWQAGNITGTSLGNPPSSYSLILRYLLEPSRTAPHDLLLLWRFRIITFVPTLKSVV